MEGCYLAPIGHTLPLNGPDLAPVGPNLILEGSDLAPVGPAGVDLIPKQRGS